MHQVLEKSGTGYAATRPSPANANEVDLTLGELRVNTATTLRDLLALTWRDDELRYNTPAGTWALRAAYLAALSIDLGRPVPATEANVVITSGAKQALWLALGCAVRTDDVVLMPRPGWAPYQLWCEAQGARVATYDACSSDPSPLFERMEATRARVVIVNSPCNPTGAEFTQRQLDSIADQAATQGVTVISDEVYRNFGRAAASLAPHVARDDVRVLVADAVSKWVAAAGLRIGFLTARPDDVRQAVAMRSMVDSCPPGVTQAMAARLLGAPLAAHRDGLRRWALRRVAGLREVLAVNEVAVKSHGGLYIWARRQETPDRIVLKRDGVILRGAHGALFGDDLHVRLCPSSDAPEIDKLLNLGDPAHE